MFRSIGRAIERLLSPLLRWLFPNGIQGERGGWKDDVEEDPPKK